MIVIVVIIKVIIAIIIIIIIKVNKAFELIIAEIKNLDQLL